MGKSRRKGGVLHWRQDASKSESEYELQENCLGVRFVVVDVDVVVDVVVVLAVVEVVVVVVVAVKVSSSSSETAPASGKLLLMGGV